MQFDQLKRREFLSLLGAATTWPLGVQAQRDLRAAQNSELRALLNYRKSLVEFDRVQQAGAATGGTTTSASTTASQSQ